MSIENIVYSDWEFQKAAVIAQNFAQSGRLPDAFICANDEIDAVVKRADELMYETKKKMKSGVQVS